MKYRLTRDDGAQIDVAGVVWESVLELAYRYGWRPTGTDAPRTSALSRWTRADYFSASSQYVRAVDARELGTAALRGDADRGGGTPDREAKRDAGVRKVADFARFGGFVIGRAPEPDHSSSA